jgi:hypothetical protein
MLPRDELAPDRIAAEMPPVSSSFSSFGLGGALYMITSISDTRVTKQCSICPM